MNCPNCGAVVAPNESRCAKCGTILQVAATEQVAPVVAAAPQSEPQVLTGFDALIRASQICVLEKYATFSGRASRGEYWWFYLFTVLLGIVAGILEVMMGIGTDTTGPISGLLNLALLVPGLAAGVRRLHDGGRSGWWMLLVLTIIGIFVILYWLIVKGDEGANEYGEPSYLLAK
ncbi:MAG: hypothetical protein RL336_1325 [Pseudomonadota bacterium]|jgi:uncharacterized membrane protein YhaH (DUF805 family)